MLEVRTQKTLLEWGKRSHFYPTLIVFGANSHYDGRKWTAVVETHRASGGGSSCPSRNLKFFLVKMGIWSISRYYQAKWELHVSLFALHPVRIHMPPSTYFLFPSLIISLIISAKWSSRWKVPFEDVIDQKSSLLLIQMWHIVINPMTSI